MIDSKILALSLRNSVDWGGLPDTFLPAAEAMIALRRGGASYTDLDSWLLERYGKLWGIGWNTLEDWTGTSEACFRAASHYYETVGLI